MNSSARGSLGNNKTRLFLWTSGAHIFPGGAADCNNSSRAEDNQDALARVMAVAALFAYPLVFDLFIVGLAVARIVRADD